MVYTRICLCNYCVADIPVGSQAERAETAERILDERDQINVVVSTYEFAAKPEDNRFMRRLKPEV
jgi:SWI/SNF-related matrix-associated actin-dependent regulator of chromatin subfamily A containing DEAD/H box 1